MEVAGFGTRPTGSLSYREEVGRAVSGKPTQKQKQQQPCRVRPAYTVPHAPAETLVVVVVVVVVEVVVVVVVVVVIAAGVVAVVVVVVAVVVVVVVAVVVVAVVVVVEEVVVEAAAGGVAIAVAIAADF